MSLTKDDLQKIKGLLSSTTQTSEHHMREYMDSSITATVTASEARIIGQLRQEIRESENRTYEFMAELADDIHTPLQANIDNHEQRLRRLERWRQ